MTPDVVFIGHVDAGKSTMGGQLLALTGMVDRRTLEKYQKSVISHLFPLTGSCAIEIGADRVECGHNSGRPRSWVVRVGS